MCMDFSWIPLQTINTAERETPLKIAKQLEDANINILDAILSVNPVAVDVNSGVESSAGKKDHPKIEKLFEVLKETEQTGFNFG